VETENPDPSAVLGLFDPTARPYVAKTLLTFAVPFGLFRKMEENVPESFLPTRTWTAVRKRIRNRNRTA